MGRYLGHILIFLLVFSVLEKCAVSGPSGTPENQGFLWQLPDGNLEAHITSKGLHDDPRLKKTSVIMMYIYKKGAEIFQPCDSSETSAHCLDAFGFTNDPGFFGYSPTYKNYSPLLMDGGINPHPITYLNLELTQHLMRGFAADGKEFAQTYFFDYNEFQSLNHVVFDGDRFDVYFAVHFDAMKQADPEAFRFDKNSSVYLRPIAPDLISPKVSIKIKLLAEGPQDEPGNYYEIPPYETWTSCASDSANTGDVVISEILWGGSQADDNTFQTTDQMVEIANRTSKDIGIGGWKLIVDSKTLTFPPCLTLKANAVLAIAAHKQYAFSESGLYLSGLSLNSSGSQLTVQDSSGSAVYSLDCTGGWGAGNNNTTSSNPNTSMVQKANPAAAVTGCTSADWQDATSAGSKLSSLYNDYTRATPGQHP